MFTNRLRRDLLKLAAAGVATASTSGWFGLLADRAARAAEPGRQAQVVHPALDGRRPRPVAHLRPQARRRVQADQHLRARHPDQRAPAEDRSSRCTTWRCLRSMKTGDGNHRTATYLMHTGFRQGSGGGLVHPSLGAIVASRARPAGLRVAQLRRRRQRPRAGLSRAEVSPLWSSTTSTRACRT